MLPPLECPPEYQPKILTSLFFTEASLPKNQNLSDPSLYEQHLIHKLETFKNCKEVKHIIMIVAVIYIFLILCDIWSIVEN